MNNEYRARDNRDVGKALNIPRKLKNGRFEGFEADDWSREGKRCPWLGGTHYRGMKAHDAQSISSHPVHNLSLGWMKFGGAYRSG